MWKVTAQDTAGRTFVYTVDAPDDAKPMDVTSRAYGTHGAKLRTGEVSAPLAPGAFTECVSTAVVEIPADVRDTSQTVTDYAYMGHLSHNKGMRSPAERDTDIRYADLYGYTRYQWYDVNQGHQDGRGPGQQRCRFDMLVKDDGTVTHLFHTEYFTRVACPTHNTRYAACYASVTNHETGVTTLPRPYCDDCMKHLDRSARDSGMTVNRSEPLIIGQHD